MAQPSASRIARHSGGGVPRRRSFRGCGVRADGSGAGVGTQVRWRSGTVAAVRRAIGGGAGVGSGGVGVARQRGVTSHVRSRGLLVMVQRSRCRVASLAALHAPTGGALPLPSERPITTALRGSMTAESRGGGALEVSARLGSVSLLSTAASSDTAESRVAAESSGAGVLEASAELGSVVSSGTARSLDEARKSRYSRTRACVSLSSVTGKGWTCAWRTTSPRS